MKLDEALEQLRTAMSRGLTTKGDTLYNAPKEALEFLLTLATTGEVTPLQHESLKREMESFRKEMAQQTIDYMRDEEANLARLSRQEAELRLLRAMVQAATQPEFDSPEGVRGWMPMERRR